MAPTTGPIVVRGVNPGDVVQDGSALYRYIGAAHAYDLTGHSNANAPDFSDSSKSASS